MKWSRLYPRAWRAKFGEEFDGMLDLKQPSFGDKSNVVVHALGEHVSVWTRRLPFVFAWVIVGFFNTVAHEVQWAAGALLLSCCLTAFWSQRHWFRNTLLFFAVIPVSSLYFYQIPGIHHEPLYKTAVAVIPAFVGSFMGLALRSVSRLSAGTTA